MADFDYQKKECPKCKRVGMWSDPPQVFIVLERKQAVETRYCVCGLQMAHFRPATLWERLAEKRRRKK